MSDGIRREVGQDQIDIKQPRCVFSDSADALLAERSSIMHSRSRSSAIAGRTRWNAGSRRLRRCFPGGEP